MKTRAVQKESTQPKTDIEFTREWCSSVFLVWFDLNLNTANVLNSFLGCMDSLVKRSCQLKLFTEQHNFLYKTVAENAHRLGLKCQSCVKSSAQDICQEHGFTPVLRLACPDWMRECGAAPRDLKHFPSSKGLSSLSSELTTSVVGLVQESTQTSI